PAPMAHRHQPDGGAPAPAPTPGRSIHMVLQMKIPQNQSFDAECRDYGIAHGHDGLLVGVCRLRVSHPEGPQGDADHLPQSKGPTRPKPYGSLGLPVLWRHPSAAYPWGGRLRAEPQ